MATIVISTTVEEQETVIKALGIFKGDTVAVSAIARESHIPQNRCRYVLDDLIAQGRVLKIPTKTLNVHFVRYRYDVLN